MAGPSSTAYLLVSGVLALGVVAMSGEMPSSLERLGIVAVVLLGLRWTVLEMRRRDDAAAALAKEYRDEINAAHDKLLHAHSHEVMGALHEIAAAIRQQPFNGSRPS